MFDVERAEADMLDQARQVVEEQDPEQPVEGPAEPGSAVAEADPADVHEQSLATGDAEETYPPDLPG